jgi:hypothetical protein
MIEMYWSPVVRLKNIPEHTVEPTTLTVRCAIRKNNCEMAVSIPLPYITPPKHIAQMMSQMVFIIPPIPLVATKSSSSRFPVGMAHSVVDVMIIALSAAITASKDAVLVEADADGNMLVKAINAVMDCDADMLDAASTGIDDFDGARYYYTPALGGIMYTHKMSPIPACVKKLNQSKINGWFQIQSV